MLYKNEMKLRIKALSENESFCRACVASFCSGLLPTIEELGDIKTAVSEAVTNAVVHAYPNDPGFIDILVKILGDTVYITITDAGVGIVDIERAREPFYTTIKNGERSGMGFSVMESFMDNVVVKSKLGKGVTVTMTKKIGSNACAIGG